MTLSNPLAHLHRTAVAMVSCCASCTSRARSI